MEPEEKYVIEKSYEFKDNDNSKTTIYIQLSHEEAIDLAEMFMEEECCEVDGNIKDMLDQANADCIAQNLFTQWKESQSEERLLEEFYDEAWDFLAETVLYYVWSPELIRDCLDYYKQNDASRRSKNPWNIKF